MEKKLDSINKNARTGEDSIDDRLLDNALGNLKDEMRHRRDNKEFLKYLEDAKKEFINTAWYTKPNANARLVFEDFIIAYDQAVQQIKNFGPAFPGDDIKIDKVDYKINEKVVTIFQCRDCETTTTIGVNRLIQCSNCQGKNLDRYITKATGTPKYNCNYCKDKGYYTNLASDNPEIMVKKIPCDCKIGEQYKLDSK